MTDSTTPPPVPRPEPELPEVRLSRDAFEPLGSGAGISAIFEAVLKTPKRLFTEIREGSPWRVAGAMTLVSILCLALYGFITGCFSGGGQLLWAPVKIVAGTCLGLLICLPSLYIFTCLSQVEARVGEVVACATAALALVSILLMGLAPVLFVFTVSTESIVFMGLLHLLFWGVAGLAGTRFLLKTYLYLRGTASPHILLWLFMLTVVLLQTSTAIRPILGRSDTVLTAEKKFFLQHWLDVGAGR